MTKSYFSEGLGSTTNQYFLFMLGVLSSLPKVCCSEKSLLVYYIYIHIHIMLYTIYIYIHYIYIYVHVGLVYNRYQVPPINCLCQCSPLWPPFWPKRRCWTWWSPTARASAAWASGTPCRSSGTGGSAPATSRGWSSWTPAATEYAMFVVGNDGILWDSNFDGCFMGFYGIWWWFYGGFMVV